MATNNYNHWYRVGTVSVTNGSKYVTGVSTYWLSCWLNPGDFFTTDNGERFYEIDEITDSTHITLKVPYAGETLSDITYAAVRLMGATDKTMIASAVAGLVNDMTRYIDLDMQTIRGKSAYEIAVQNGFSGTQSEWLETLTAYGVAVKNGYTGSISEWQESLTAYGVARKNGYTGTVTEWLESLKAAGEWTRLDSRTSYLTAGTIGLRNSLYRGKNLGNAVTDEQALAITKRTWTDMYLGDYWTINGTTYTIAEFTDNTYTKASCDPDTGGLCIITHPLAIKPMHSSDDVTSYVATDMFNVTIPELVETKIDPDFRGLAKLHYEWLDAGTSTWGQVRGQTKANLLSFANIWGFTYPYYNEKTAPYHDWQLPLFRYNLWANCVYDNGEGIWTMTRTGSNYFYYAFRHRYIWDHTVEGSLPTVARQPVLYFFV